MSSARVGLQDAWSGRGTRAPAVRALALIAHLVVVATQSCCSSCVRVRWGSRLLRAKGLSLSLLRDVSRVFFFLSLHTCLLSRATLASHVKAFWLVSFLLECCAARGAVHAKLLKQNARRVCLSNGETF